MKSFCSKILLFGEYSIIKGSRALCIPYSLFSGHLRFPTDKKSPQCDRELWPFGQYLKMLRDKGELNFLFKIDEFISDLSQGLYFESSIPVGYGAGSSGALCAAVYERYCSQDSDIPLTELKKRLGLLEGYFHGSSSGLDPLTSFVAKTLLVETDKSITLVDLPIGIKNESEGKGAIFLLNTMLSRRTGPHVHLFLEKYKNPDFAEALHRSFIPSTNACVEFFLKGEWNKLEKSFREISEFQFENFLSMIPTLYHEIWKRGPKERNYSLKLCGAGGGGLILGMTPDFKKTQELLLEHDLRPIFFF